MNLPVYYSLIGAELGLVVGIGVLAARKALRRQEILHAALALETIRPVPRLEFGAAIAIPMEEARPDEPEPVELHVVAEDVAPAAHSQRLDSALGAKWVAEARDAAIAIANVKGEVTADDVISACPVPAGVHTRYVASVFSDKTEWQKVGERSSKRSHRMIAVWRLKQGEAVA